MKSSSTARSRGSRRSSSWGRRAARSFRRRAGGLGALLNSAPELIDRIQRLTERLTELLNDKNQNAISDILENIDATTQVIRQRAPDMAETIAEVRIAARNAGIAANNIAALTDNTNRLVSEQGRPPQRICARRSPRSSWRRTISNAMITDARPGVQNFSKSTLPEANRLVRDLRELSQSLQSFRSA